MTQHNGFIYLKVPIKWKAIYRTLLKLMAKEGYAMLEDCNSSCTGNSKKLINCWNMFNAACAALDDNNEKLALSLIMTVIGDLNAKFNLNIDVEEYKDMSFDESKYDKLEFGDIDFFIEETINTYGYTTFDEIYNGEQFTNAEDLYTYIKSILTNDWRNYITRLIYDEDFEKRNYNYLYFDDEDDLTIDCAIKNNVFIVFIPNKYDISKIYYKSDENKTNIKEVFKDEVSHGDKDYNFYIYFINDVTNNKTVTIELEKV